MRSLLLANRNAATRTVNLHINGSSPSTAMLYEVVLQPASVIELHDIVLNAGDVLSGKASANTSVAISGFGSLLNGAWGEVET